MLIMRFSISAVLALAICPVGSAVKVTISYQTELSAVAHHSEWPFACDGVIGSQSKVDISNLFLAYQSQLTRVTTANWAWNQKWYG